MMMELTVLGSHSPYAPANGACSGYLLNIDGFHIMLDCGNGSFSRLQKHSAEMTAAKQPMNEKKLRFLMFVSLLVFPTRMFNFIHRLRAAINGFSFAESRTRA